MRFPQYGHVFARNFSHFDASDQCSPAQCGIDGLSSGSQSPEERQMP